MVINTNILSRTDSKTNTSSPMGCIVTPEANVWQYRTCPLRFRNIYTKATIRHKRKIEETETDRGI